MLRSAARRLGKALLVVEHNNTVPSPATLSAITAATKFGPVTALVAGKGQKAAVDAVSKVKGVDSVISVDSEEYANQLPENVAALIDKIRANGFTHIVAPHTAFGKGVIPRAAALADCTPLADVLAIESETTFKRPTYAGNAIITVKSEKEPFKFLTVRPTAFDKAATEGGSAKVEESSAAGGVDTVKWIKDEVDDSGKPDLTQARVVISGGRGLQKKENFKLLWDLADKIPNCAVGATRAVVESEWVPSDLQVGQTGKVVAPELYIAVGLSGAIQHIAGMKDSKCIVAINKDADAPIFTISDYGLVADLFDAVPKLDALVSKK